MNILSWAAGAAKALFDKAIVKISGNVRARRRLLEEVLEKLTRISAQKPRPKNRMYLEFAVKNMTVISSAEARNLLESAYDYNTRNKLNHFTDDDVIQRICAEIRNEINGLM